MEPTVFWGAATAHRVDVYVRLNAQEVPTGAGAAGGEPGTLAGVVHGPFRADAATLKARYPLKSLGNDPQPLARATVLDPCGWSPWSASTYQVDVQWQGPTCGESRIPVGVRMLAAREGSFSWEGKRWVFRGVCDWPRDLADCRSLAELRGGVCGPAGEMPAEVAGWATQTALPLALLARDSAEAEQAFRIARRSPAVWTIVAPASIAAELVALRTDYAPNLLLGAYLTSSQSAPAWADSLWGDCDVLRRLPAEATAPRVAVDWTRQAPEDLAARRAACDRLQRRCRPWGDFAGYVESFPLSPASGGPVDPTPGT